MVRRSGEDPADAIPAQRYTNERECVFQAGTDCCVDQQDIQSWSSGAQAPTSMGSHLPPTGFPAALARLPLRPHTHIPHPRPLTGAALHADLGRACRRRSRGRQEGRRRQHGRLKCRRQLVGRRAGRVLRRNRALRPHGPAGPLRTDVWGGRSTALLAAALGQRVVIGAGGERRRLRRHIRRCHIQGGPAGGGLALVFPAGAKQKRSDPAESGSAASGGLCARSHPHRRGLLARWKAGGGAAAAPRLITVASATNCSAGAAFTASGPSTKLDAKIACMLAPVTVNQAGVALDQRSTAGNGDCGARRPQRLAAASQHSQQPPSLLAVHQPAPRATTGTLGDHI